MTENPDLGHHRDGHPKDHATQKTTRGCENTMDSRMRNSPGPFGARKTSKSAYRGVNWYAAPQHFGLPDQRRLNFYQEFFSSLDVTDDDLGEDQDDD